jgi:hypothetical protein
VTKRAAKYDTVDLAKLRRSRRGKHHEMTQGILNDLAVLPKGKAMKIPLASANGVSIVNLRAAIVRATSSQKLRVNTYTDGESLFIWKEDTK